MTKHYYVNTITGEAFETKIKVIKAFISDYSQKRDIDNPFWELWDRGCIIKIRIKKGSKNK